MLKRIRIYLVCSQAVIIALAQMPTACAATTEAAKARKFFGELSVRGTVEINGLPATTGLTIFPASRIETGEGSSATVSLGALGRVELLAESKVRLDFAQSVLTLALTEGALRCSLPRGVNAEVLTPDGYVSADTNASSLFVVRVERGRTSVETEEGRATLHLEDRSVEVRSGEHYAAGVDAPRPSASDDDEELSKGKKAGIIVVAVAAIGLIGSVIYLAVTDKEASDDEVLCPCCFVLCVSPSR